MRTIKVGGHRPDDTAPLDERIAYELKNLTDLVQRLRVTATQSAKDATEAVLHSERALALLRAAIAERKRRAASVGGDQ
jgi:hypothetical protein